MAGGPEAGAVGDAGGGPKAVASANFPASEPGYDNKIPDGPAVEKTTQTPKI